jgi:hypothetical protein
LFRLEVSLASGNLSIRYIIGGGFSLVGSVSPSSFRSKLGLSRYLEVFRSEFFQLKSINFRKPFHPSLHSTRLHGRSASIHQQQLHHRTSLRRGVLLTCQCWVMLLLLLLLSTDFLRLCRFPRWFGRY